MDYSGYRKIFKFQNDMDSAKRRELLRIYLQTPSLPQLQAVRALLIELKTTLSNCETSRKKCVKAVWHLLCKRRSM